MPLTQSELAQALNNLSALHTLASTNQVSAEDRQIIHDMILGALNRWELRGDAPEDDSVTLVKEEE